MNTTTRNSMPSCVMSRSCIPFDSGASHTDVQVEVGSETTMAEPLELPLNVSRFCEQCGSELSFERATEDHDGIEVGVLRAKCPGCGWKIRRHLTPSPWFSIE